jgi:hypothetical protein
VPGRLETRGREPGEPPTSTPIYVRFGMTRGALVAVTLLVVAAIVGFVRLETLAADQRGVTRRLAKVVADVRQQQRRNEHALREVCRQATILQGVANAGENLAAGLLATGQLPHGRSQLIYALVRFRGYQVQLMERPACNEVLNP